MKVSFVKIAFLHTAAIHVQTFDGLLDQLGYGGERSHRVMPELLSRAREQGLDAVRQEVAAVIAELSDADAVMCTCSTLGPVADEMAAQFGHVFRVDRPVMEKACKLGGDILVAICLQSTQAATLALLHQCASAMAADVTPRVVLCAQAWPFFESGDMDGFAASIAQSIRREVSGGARPNCILLAQASMRVAESALCNLGVTVISSPLLATKRAIKIAQAR